MLKTDTEKQALATIAAGICAACTSEDNAILYQGADGYMYDRVVLNVVAEASLALTRRLGIIESEQEDDDA